MNDTPDAVTDANDRENNSAFYDQFFGPLFFEPYAVEVAKRIDPNLVSVALEIAAGTGRVTRHLREHIPATSKLIASDISGDMLEVAKKNLSHLDIGWQLIDAQELPFSDNSIDLVVCCFGYMFVPDKSKAIAAAYRVLRKGGSLLFTTWDRLEKNAISYISTTVAMQYLEAPLPASYYLPTSMSDETAIRSLLQDAGFSSISIEKVEQLSVSPAAKEAACGLIQGGDIYKQILKRNPARIGEIKIKLEKELADRFGAAPMVAPISALISQAWK